MSEKLNAHETSAEDNPDTYEGGVAYPKFDPEEASRLRNEGATRLSGESADTLPWGMAVSKEEAQKIGENRSSKSVYETKEATLRAWEAGVENGTIDSANDLAPEQRNDANRALFADIQKRRAFIAKLYPVLTEDREWNDPELGAVPNSVRHEYEYGQTLAKKMIEARKKGREDFVRYPNGMVIGTIETYQNSLATGTEERLFNIQIMQGYEEAKEQNDGIFNLDTLATFEPERPDLEARKAELSKLVDSIRKKDKLGDLDTPLDLLKNGQIPNIGITTDFDAACKWADADAWNTVSYETYRQRDQIRHDVAEGAIDKLGRQLEAARATKQQLEDEYKNANPLRRVWLLVHGHRDKIKKSERTISSTARKLSGLKNERNQISSLMRVRAEKTRARDQGNA